MAPDNRGLEAIGAIEPVVGHEWLKSVARVLSR
jgi:hypothetical protein